MSEIKRYLAFDFGASSGRLMLGEYEDGKISLKEIHRFSNDPTMINDRFVWDLPRLFYEIKQGLLKSRVYENILGLGIDTWGVDFALLDKRGNLLGNPVHYRDKRTRNIENEVFDKINKDKLYSVTGNQLMEINSLFQLMAIKKSEEDILSIADKMLLMPDLFSYLLTGQISAEKSIVSTTQMYDHSNGNWAREIVDKLGLDNNLLPEIVESGSIKGYLSEKICEELDITSIPVFAVCGHDTQSAMLSVPAEEDSFAYLSCGTWSLLGSEIDKPILTKEAMESEFTNEVGYANKVSFLKNITGLWLIQESKRQFEKEGKEYTFADMATLAMNAKSTDAYIDTDAEVFASAGNIPKRVREWCIDRGMSDLNTDGKIIKCIYESLVFKYRKAIEELGILTNNTYDVLYVIGGGTMDKVFMQMIADGLNITVSAGPTEATALGNIGAQLLANGQISDIKEFRKIIKQSEDIIVYKPNLSDRKYWDNGFAKYMEVMRKK